MSNFPLNLYLCIPRSVWVSDLITAVSSCSGQWIMQKLTPGQSAENKWLVESSAPDRTLHPSPTAQGPSLKKAWEDFKSQRSGKSREELSSGHDRVTKS